MPRYVIEVRGVIDKCYAKNGLRVYRQHIAPAMGITQRFVGSEPFCTVTADYNRDMRRCLSDPAMDAPPIELVEIERVQYQGKAISASWVRQLLVKQQIATIEHLVPPTTFDYLQQMLPAGKQPHSESVTGET